MAQVPQSKHVCENLYISSHLYCVPHCRSLNSSAPFLLKPISLLKNAFETCLKLDCIAERQLQAASGWYAFREGRFGEIVFFGVPRCVNQIKSSPLTCGIVLQIQVITYSSKSSRAGPPCSTESLRNDKTKRIGLPLSPILGQQTRYSAGKNVGNTL